MIDLDFILGIKIYPESQLSFLNKSTEQFSFNFVVGGFLGFRSSKVAWRNLVFKASFLELRYIKFTRQNSFQNYLSSRLYFTLFPFTSYSYVLISVFYQYDTFPRIRIAKRVSFGSCYPMTVYFSAGRIRVMDCKGCGRNRYLTKIDPVL